ncbi:MAG: hypothetical protein R3C11_03950 [Planctomycetaceae bacterium]
MFMFFNKDAKKKAKRKSKGSLNAKSWLTRNLFRPFPLLCLALLATLAILTPRIYQKLPNLADDHRYQFTMENIYLVDRPDWVPPYFLRSVLAQHQIPDNVLEPELARTISTWFANEPWVEKVDSVRISYPPTAMVKLSFREPVAVVQLDGRLYPIDESGVLLPQNDFAPGVLERYPVLESNRVPPPLYVGRVWEDVNIKQGAKLASQLNPHWNSFDFISIRPQTVKKSLTAPEAQEEPTFEIVSASGSIIIWGRGPGTNHPGELSVDEKIRRLVAYQERFEGFALPQGPYEIDITHWNDISRRVLSQAATETNSRR